MSFSEVSFDLHSRGQVYVALTHRSSTAHPCLACTLLQRVGWGGGGIAPEIISNKMGFTESYSRRLLGSNSSSSMKTYWDNMLHFPCFQSVCSALCIECKVYRLRTNDYFFPIATTIYNSGLLRSPSTPLPALHDFVAKHQLPSEHNHGAS